VLESFVIRSVCLTYMYPCNVAVIYLPRSQQRSHRREPLRYRPSFRVSRAATWRLVLCLTSKASLQCFRTLTTPTVNSRSSKFSLVTVNAAFSSQHQRLVHIFRTLKTLSSHPSLFSYTVSTSRCSTSVLWQPLRLTAKAWRGATTILTRWSNVHWGDNGALVLAEVLTVVGALERLVVSVERAVAALEVFLGMEDRRERVGSVRSRV